MKFGKTLASSVYDPWKDKYIDYAKLKSLLRETTAPSAEDGNEWTDDDEARFAEELLNVQLEKVNNFQTEKYQDIKTRTGQCEGKLKALKLVTPQAVGDSHPKASEEEETTMRELLPELDAISNEISQLECFSRINFSGFRKIVKKHDKRRGSAYKLRAILSARLADLPLNTEDYSPLLYRLSAIYSFVRHHLQDEQIGQNPNIEFQPGDEEYDSVTYFVHPDDLVEVKTFLLRHLPALVYNPSSNKILEGPQNDPSLTSIYFDSQDFSLYRQRLQRHAGASSLRLRWFGRLEDTAEVTLERKTLAEQASSRDQRIQLKRKYIPAFLKGEYDMSKKVSRLRERGPEFESEADLLQSKIQEVQQFITSEKLRPLLRATYKRTAFQVPGDDSIRVSIDTDLKFSRESLSREVNRLSLAEANETFPSPDTTSSDASDFPWAVLTIKLRGERNNRAASWVHDLTSSHLLREAPKFSKFVHGIASLFEDNVNEHPFWMSLMDTDIRRDPQSAFEEEQNREEQLLEETQAVGSYGGTPRRKSSIHPYSMQPRNALSPPQGAAKASYSVSPGLEAIRDENNAARLQDKVDKVGSLAHDSRAWLSGFRGFLPALSSSKYARSRRQRVELPPGVEEPKNWIKDSGPVKVEPKVWLANQRTFIKWQHVSVLLASLSLALYNSAGRHNDVAKALGIVYTVVAVIIAVWGWSMHDYRSRLIRARSGKDLDNVLGPVIVSISLGLALCFNLGLRLNA